jgi:hypothetical protein
MNTLASPLIDTVRAIVAICQPTGGLSAQRLAERGVPSNSARVLFHAGIDSRNVGGSCHGQASGREVARLSTMFLAPARVEGVELPWK